MTAPVTLPDRMASMRCLNCEHEWQDMDAATNEYPQPCPGCRSFRTETAYDVDGTLMPEGWTW